MTGTMCADIGKCGSVLVERAPPGMKPISCRFALIGNDVALVETDACSKRGLERA